MAQKPSKAKTAPHGNDEAASEHHGRRTCVLVLGMHRSGTSAAARIVNLLGAALPQNLLGAGPGNEIGHWEPIRLMQLHDQMLAEAGSSWHDWRKLDLEAQLPEGRLEYYKAEIRRLIDEEFGKAPLFVLKEPRICRFVPLYRDVFGEMSIDIRPVLVFRSPLEVAASLRARNEIATSQSYLLWLRHVLNAETATRDLPRAVVYYHDLMSDWRRAIERFEKQLALTWPNQIADVGEAINGFISPSHRHHVADDVALSVTPAASDWVRRANSAVNRLREDAAIAFIELDAIGREFDAGADLFGASLADDRQKDAEALAAMRQQDAEALAAMRQQAEAEVLVAMRQKAEAEALAAMRQHDAEDLAMIRQQDAEVLAAIREQLDAAREDGRELADRLRTQIDISEKRIAEVHQAYQTSTSWKLTKPLRKLKLLRFSRNVGGSRSTSTPLGLKAWAPGRVYPAVRHRVRILGIRNMLKLTGKVFAREGFAGIQRRIRASHQLGHVNVANFPGPQSLLDERRTFLRHPTLSPRPIRSATVPSVLILSETLLPQCQRYRVQHKVEALRTLGIATQVANPSDLYSSLNMLQYSSAVIAYRLPDHDLFRIHIDEARRLGIPVAYDVDDPVFDEQALGANASLAQLSPAIREGQLRDTLSFRSAARASDFCIGSTPNLATLMRDVAQSRQRKAFVWRNGLDRETLEIGKSLIHSSKISGNEIVIGYFSGSLAHNSDFDIVREPLFELMQRNRSVRLAVGGHLGDMSEFLSFGNRVRQHPFLDYEQYIRCVASCDLLLVPLCDDIFNKHKSAVRFLDAASVGKPVVASAVGDFVNVISHGETGFVVKNNEWGEALLSLTEDKERLRQVGRNARADAECNFSIDSICMNLDSDLKLFLGASKCASLS